MWLDSLLTGDSWMGVWKHKFICGGCHGIISDYVCPICEYNNYIISPFEVDSARQMGREPAVTLMGAYPYTTHLLLELMQREWDRPLAEVPLIVIDNEKAPQRLIIVLLFWSLFENLMEVFFTQALSVLPKAIADDLLKHYSSIGSRLDRLYKLLFATTFKEDILSLGKVELFEHLERLQKKRNAFVHGDPKAITEDLVRDTVLYLQDVQSAWIDLYNRRCTRKQPS
jgi:hypothetical protein